MGFAIAIAPYRRTKKETEEEWYLSPDVIARQERIFVETYFTPPEPSIALLKCEHGIYLGDQPGYCTLCAEYIVSGPGPYKRDDIGVAFGIGRSAKRLLGQTVFSKPFPRRGFVTVRCQVLPPVDQHLKMRTVEAVGGYVRKGLAVRAGKGFAHKTNEKDGAESFVRLTTNRLPMSFATMPNPIRGFRAWTYPDSDHFFAYVAAYRNEYRTVPPPEHDFPSCTITHFGRQDTGGLRLLSERLSDARRKACKKGENNRRSECVELAGIDWKHWRPPNYEPTEKDQRLWQRKHWSKRAPYDPTEGEREPLNLTEETRTDRETRARLKVKWGGRWRPKEMHQRVWTQLHEARRRVATTATGPACWPSDTHPSLRALRGDSFGGAVPHNSPHWKKWRRGSVPIS